MKKVFWGVVAAFTTPEAIKAEKSLGAIVCTRAAVLIPSAGFAFIALAHFLGA